tara:strand:+ start:530 stop:907 length:378 start_codon:yes stop_codon:yes gene_type:complete
MKLSIIRYMNCGTKFWSGPVSPNESERIHTSEEYFSFFELNNEKVIYVCFAQNFIDKKPTSIEIDFQYAEDYYFLDDFYVWWRKQMDIDEDILGQPNEEEKALVENFFMINIEKTKEVKTEIVYL